MKTPQTTVRTATDLLSLVHTPFSSRPHEGLPLWPLHRHMPGPAPGGGPMQAKLSLPYKDLTSPGAWSYPRAVKLARGGMSPVVGQKLSPPDYCHPPEFRRGKVLRQKDSSAALEQSASWLSSSLLPQGSRERGEH